MKRIIAVLLLVGTLTFGQSTNNKGTKETDTQTTNGNVTPLKFLDNLGTQTNSFEMQASGSPATVTVTIDGCMRGGKCNTSIGSSSSTTSTIINLNMANGPYDYYNVNWAMTGGTNPVLTFNRTGTAARSSSSASGGVTNLAVTTPITTTGATGSVTVGCPTCTITIASGTAALGTGAISSATCATVVTVAGAGILTTDDIIADFNADPTSTVGYQASASGMLTIIKYPTSGNVNFKVCNNTGASITPGAATLNWRVVR